MVKQVSVDLNPRALVIGAGIGGLCAAIALYNQGWQVTVIESSPERRDEGAGIVLAANAIKALAMLGIRGEVERLGAPVGKAEIRTWDGQLLVDLPTASQAQRYGSPSYLIHRSALQAILYDQLKEGTTVQFNKKLVQIQQSSELVTACFADGSQVAGGLLIGADGIHSKVREQLFGRPDLRYSGYTAIRGVAEFHDKRYPMQTGGGFEAWGPGKRFGYSNLGQGRIFWFGAINSPEGIVLPIGERKQAALRHFQGWYGPIEAVIAATDEAAILSHDIYDSKPTPTWGKGRVALLGDAAHPMLPNLGQGGAQAIEDAAVLSQCMQGCTLTHVPDALRSYEQRRIPRTTKVVRRSRIMGRMVQLENPAIVKLRNLMLRTLPPEIQMKRLNWLLGYEVIK